MNDQSIDLVGINNIDNASAPEAKAVRVAIIHDWLTTFAGSERVLAEIIALYPEADLFTLVDFLSPKDRKRISNKVAKTSFIQKLPFAKKHYRSYFPLMPLAIEQFDLSQYDLLISSSHAFAKGILVGPNQKHVCYCHTPIRYAWDLQHNYLNEAGLTRGLKGMIARISLHYIRLWDNRTNFGVDHFVSNSKYVARRIRRVYGRRATVVYPPIDTDYFEPKGTKEDFYFTASRMVPYKRIDLIVKAFSEMPDRRLIVIGDGPDMEKIRRLAGPNVTLLGFQDDETLRDHLQRARAFVFAAEEDFGILPLEAQACDTPVIAYGRGGALETVIDMGSGADSGSTGVLFPSQTVPAIVDAIHRFERTAIAPGTCRKWSENFGLQAFRASLSKAIAMSDEPCLKD